MSKAKGPAVNADEIEETIVEEAPTLAPKFSVERLGQECRKLFDVSSCLYAGATYGLEGEYTVTEMRQIIENWKRMEVR